MTLPMVAAWTAARPGDPVGRFGVLECVDYAWYEPDAGLRVIRVIAAVAELDKAVL